MLASIGYGVKQFMYQVSSQTSGILDWRYSKFLSVSNPQASQAAVVAIVFSDLIEGSLMVVSECKSAIKNRASFSESLDNFIPGIMAPSKLPK